MRAPRVIVTRPSPDAEAFAAELARAGFAPILSPAMAIRTREGPVDLAGVGALAFTSANGVRAFAENSPVRGLPVFAVGEATAAEAKAQGFDVAAVGQGDVESLARIVSDAKRRGRIDGAVLHVAGGDRAGDLVALLESEGVPARRAVLYVAEPVTDLSGAARAALAETPPAEWVAFFSPRTARLFIAQTGRAGLGDRLENVGALCLSEAVADAARAAPFARVAVAAARSGAAMIEALGRGGRS